MFEKETQLLDKAYETYNLDTRENISIKVLNYIRERIIDNQDVLERIIKYTEADLSFNDILNTFDTEVSKKIIYKSETTITKLENNFAYGIYTTSCGNIAIECSDPLKVLQYYIKAIMSRNTITISDSDYDDINVKTALLVIFCEALAKFNIDRNLIMLVPYEECYYDYFDKVIFEDEKQQTKEKKQVNKYYIYVENKNLLNYVKNEEEVLKHYNKNYEILTEDFYEAIKKINKEIPIGASIYTEDTNIGYKFINLVHSKNVFFNTSFVETEFIEQPKDELYMRKKIMYPLQGANDSLNTNLILTPKEEEIVEINESENMSLIPKKVNPWYKRIFEKIKNFFKK